MHTIVHAVGPLSHAPANNTHAYNPTITTGPPLQVLVKDTQTLLEFANSTGSLSFYMVGGPGGCCAAVGGRAGLWAGLGLALLCLRGVFSLQASCTPPLMPASNQYD